MRRVDDQLGGAVESRGKDPLRIVLLAEEAAAAQATVGGCAASVTISSAARTNRSDISPNDILIFSPDSRSRCRHAARLFLIDGSSQMYRAYHAMRGSGLYAVPAARPRTRSTSS